MATFKGGFGIDAEEAINADDSDIQVGYTGPTPKGGIYRGILKRMELIETGPNSKNPGTPMLKMLVEINEPKGSDKAKFNGYGIWTNQTITEQSRPFVNQVLASLVKGDEKKFKAVKTWFWNTKLVTETAQGGHIYSIGKLKVGSPDGEIEVVVNTKFKKSEEHGDKLEIKRWLVPSNDDSNDDFDSDSDELDDEDELGDDLDGEDPEF